MIHELLQITGSHNIEGTLLIPKDTGSAQTVTGSVAHQNGEIFIYNGENWQTLGAQTGITQPDFSLRYLVVAGGGGGGGWGGGGGAGGMLTGSIATVTSGSSFTMTIGGGGTAGSGGSYTAGGDGGASSLAGSGYSTVSTVGGGGGGYYNGYDGRDGGSGGGGGIAESGTNNVTDGGSGTAGQGNDGGRGGGRSGIYYGGGGGGGAGQAGLDHVGQTRGGHGGSGSLSNITGTDTFYAGGGGGHSDRTGDANVRALGGPGGGGDGGIYNNPNRSAVAGGANTGGGGGSATGTGVSYDSFSAAGGSGVVIVSYDSGSLSGFGGVRTYNNSKVAHTFQYTGTFTISNSKTQTDGTLDIFGDSSCIALYQFEGNANDKSGNYNGTASNLTYSQGYINNGGVFSGTDSSSRSKITTTNLPTYNNYSISFWMKSDDVISDADIIMGTSDSYASNVGFGLYTGHPSDGDLTWAVSNGSSRVNITAAGLTAGQWHHVVVTQNISNNEKKIYIDNTLKTTSTSTINNTNVTYSLVIGGYSGYTNSTYDGMLDQIRIFNKVLSASEVQTVYKE